MRSQREYSNNTADVIFKNIEESISYLQTADAIVKYVVTVY